MSSTDARSPGQALSRALPSAVLAMLFRSVGVLAVLAVPVVSGLGSVDGATPAPRQDPQRTTEWKDAYSERHPGCVPAVLWPADEQPVAVLTRGPDGRIYRIAVKDHRSPSGLPAGTRTIGVCR